MHFGCHVYIKSEKICNFKTKHCTQRNGKMKPVVTFWFVLMSLVMYVISSNDYIPACNHTVFCQGFVLKKVQLSSIFQDSKTFVDMPLKENLNSTIIQEILHSSNITALRTVVDTYFEKAGMELEAVNMSEPKQEPTLFTKIKDSEYKAWAKELCSIWKKLVRKMKKDVKINSKRYSLIYLAKEFVVPGGRFREMYYWDTYWSIEGLLQCGMVQITKDILANLLYLVKTFDFVPNGGRKYYKNRSQPPFLTLMMERYLHHTGDFAFIEKNFDTLVKEHMFWMKERTVSWSSLTFNQYRSKMGYPRPESYREDVEVMKKAGYENNMTAQMELYSHIASAAESGWDFSSRWFENATEMTTIHTHDIIPVDLNSILCAVEFTLGNFASKLNKPNDAQRFYSMANKRKQDINDFFWNDEFGLWLDFDMKTGQHKKSFYASSLFPLWLHTTNSSNWNKTIANKAYKTLKDLDLFKYPGGLPTSLINSGQQWDFPNAWPPLQHIAVYGLTHINIDETDDEPKKTAQNLAQTYLETAYLSWKTTGNMYEKYDVRERSKAGHGGEYEVQTGFGWTNGIALDFLNKYGQILKAPSRNTNTGSQINCANSLLLSFIICTLYLF